jgi:hypothetical protein
MVSTPIAAVHDDDLRQLLESLGVLGDLTAGRLLCRFCGSQVTERNLYAILPDSGQVRVVCDTPACVKRLAQRL